MCTVASLCPRPCPLSLTTRPCLKGSWLFGWLVAQQWAFHCSQTTRLLSGAEAGEEGDFRGCVGRAVRSVFSSWGRKETNDADSAEQSRKKRQRRDSAGLRGPAS